MSENQEVAQSLTGIRVLDLSRVVAGPWCTQLLADLGADVIKVERPHVGDDSRKWGPPFMLARHGAESMESAAFCACNRNKRSVTIDVSKPAGQTLIRELAMECDVVVENYKVGTLSRYGIGYDELSALNPRLIYCAITGFGQTGPYRHRPGYDTIIQGLGGLMSITGEDGGENGMGAVKVGIPVSDIMTGLYSTVAILAALNRRAVSGRGQFVDMSLLDVQVAALGNVGLSYLASGKVPKRQGNRLPMVYPSGSFPCQDGSLMLIVGNDEQFTRFCEATDLREVLRDPRFVSNTTRIAHASELDEAIVRSLERRPMNEWIERFAAANVPCGPINDLSQVFADPHVVARNMTVSISHPQTGEMPAIANPIRLSESPVQYHRAPPLLGQHTEEVLRELLGYDGDILKRLAGTNVI